MEKVRAKASGSNSAHAAFPRPLDSPSLLTIEEVAELLSVPASWVYERTRRRSSDRIPGFRLGKYWRFRQAEILEWLERQRTGARPNA